MLDGVGDARTHHTARLARTVTQSYNILIFHTPPSSRPIETEHDCMCAEGNQVLMLVLLLVCSVVESVKCLLVEKVPRL